MHFPSYVSKFFKVGWYCFCCWRKSWIYNIKNKNASSLFIELPFPWVLFLWHLRWAWSLLFSCLGILEEAWQLVRLRHFFVPCRSLFLVILHRLLGATWQSQSLPALLPMAFIWKQTTSEGYPGASWNQENALLVSDLEPLSMIPDTFVSDLQVRKSIALNFRILFFKDPPLEPGMTNMAHP